VGVGDACLPGLASTPILLHPCTNDHLYMFRMLSCLFSIHLYVCIHFLHHSNKHGKQNAV